MSIIPSRISFAEGGFMYFTDEVLTPAEAAEVLKVSVGTVYRLAKDGKIPAVRIGGTWRIPALRLQEMIYGEQEAESEE